MTKEEIYREILITTEELNFEEFGLLIKNIQNKVNEGKTIAINN